MGSDDRHGQAERKKLVSYRKMPIVKGKRVLLVVRRVVTGKEIGGQSNDNPEEMSDVWRKNVGCSGNKGTRSRSSLHTSAMNKAKKSWKARFLM